MHFSRSAISSEADFARSRASARVKVPIQTANGAQIYKFATQAAPAGQRKRSEESCAGRAAAIFPPRSACAILEAQALARLKWRHSSRPTRKYHATGKLRWATWKPVANHEKAEAAKRNRAREIYNAKKHALRQSESERPEQRHGVRSGRPEHLRT
jgi:hypothetical protein